MLKRATRPVAIGTTGVILLVLGAWLLGRLVTDRYGLSQWLSWIPTPAVLLLIFPAMVAARDVSRDTKRRRRWLVGWILSAAIIFAHFAFVENRLFRAAPDTIEGLRFVQWTTAHSKAGRLDMHIDEVLSLGGEITILSFAGVMHRQDYLLERLDEGQQVVHIRPFTLLTRYPLLERRELVASDEFLAVFIRLDTTATLGRPINIIVVDLPSHPSQSRWETAQRLRRMLAEADAPQPDLVCGDFNMTRQGAAFNSIFPELTHAWDLAGRGLAASYHRVLPLYHIDQMLVNTDTLRIADYTLLDPGLGRHRAQVAYLQGASESD